VLLIVLALAGCAPVVSMTPAAEFANDPGCADATVRMPDTLGDYRLRNTDAQSTAAWGQPTVALLYCGVPVPQASDLPCVQIEGIFWLREEVDAGLAFTTYGRDPAVRLVIDTDALGPGIALDDIANAVSYLPTNGRECIDLEDTVSPN
jgi:hypothetical protein